MGKGDFQFIPQEFVEYRWVRPFDPIVPEACLDLVFAGSDGSILSPITPISGRQGKIGYWHRQHQSWDPNTFWCVSLKVSVDGSAEFRQRDVQPIIALAWDRLPEPRETVRHLYPPVDNNCPDNLAWGTRREQESDKEITRERKNLFDKLLSNCAIYAKHNGRDWQASIIQSDRVLHKTIRSSKKGRTRENAASAVQRAVKEFRDRIEFPDRHSTAALEEKRPRDFPGKTGAIWIPESATPTSTSSTESLFGISFHARFTMPLKWLKIAWVGNRNSKPISQSET